MISWGVEVNEFAQIRLILEVNLARVSILFKKILLSICRHYLLVKTKLFFSLQFFLIGHGFESELSESEIAGQSLR